MAVKDIETGSEVVWDYKIKDVPWAKCKLVGSEIEGSANACDESSGEEPTKKTSTPLYKRHRRVCYCPIEGCTTKPY